MKAVLIFGIAALVALGGWGWKATQIKHVEPVQSKTAEPLCELCVSPGSRASLLMAQPALIANPAPLDEKQIAAALSEKIIGPDLALEEVRVFNETRVPEMPRVRTAAEWKTKAAQMRKDVLDKVIFRGSAAAWRQTPLKVEWGETIENFPGYRIRKLKFEALPGWWIPALLYEPFELKGKVPVVMNVNGHARTGKATDYKQLRCINLVKRGMIVLNVEWIGMGQFANRMGHYQMNQLDLCGSSGIAPFYLNMSKGLDVLLAHPSADPKRVAVAGLSGGGWQTIFISSLDERVTLANPVAGYSSFKTRARHGKDLGDSEQTPNDLALYADYTHFTAMLGNRAVLLTNNAYDACCFTAGHALPPLVDAAAPIFSLHGRRDFLRTHINFKPGTHNFGVDNRQQLYRFIGDVFYPGDKQYPRNEIPSEKEIKTYDELIVPLPKDNHTFNTLALGLIKNLPRPQEGSKKARRAKLLTIVHAKNYKTKAMKIDGENALDGVAHYQFQIANDWTIPGTVFAPANPKGTTLLISDTGRKTQTARVKELLATGQRVVAFDPFFFGESKIKSRDFLHVILMHAVGERALGVQSGQIVALANWAKNEFDGEVNLNSIGPRLSVAARLAAVQTEAIASLELDNPMKSLKEMITANKGANHFPEMMCHGLLEHFDLPQIEALK
ncbi:MAG: acetylxylan esterase [Verrucomicrobia subdivision 3 bacterium]|nr:acetylxylan esterase [Limisphaerales bacterium]